MALSFRQGHQESLPEKRTLEKKLIRGEAEPQRQSVLRGVRRVGSQSEPRVVEAREGHWERGQ